MNRGQASFDRIVTFLLFLVFGGIAFWMIGLRLDLAPAERIGDYVNRDFWADLSARDNYETILVIAAAVTGLLGLLFIGINIERKRLGRSASPSSAPTGTIRTSPADVASAAYRASEDRGTDIIEIRLRIPAETDVTELNESCRRAAADITAALPGQDVLPRFLLQTDKD